MKSIREFVGLEQKRVMETNNLITVTSTHVLKVTIKAHFSIINIC